MMRATTLLAVSLFASGCIGTVTGFGENSKGEPVSGNYTAQAAFDEGKPNLDLKFVTGDGRACASLVHLKGLGPWTFPTNCSGGVKGKVTMTPDRSAARDVADYRLSNGERGRLVFGGTTNGASQSAANDAAYMLGCALAGGGCAPPGSPQPRPRPQRQSEEVKCTVQTGIILNSGYVKCKVE